MLTQQDLQSALSYDRVTGVFSRLIRSSNRITLNGKVGSIDRAGYRCIRVGGKTYKAHRLAWLYVYGVWPVGEIDHINHVKDDNFIANLRDVTKSANQQNRLSVRGYSKDGNSWKAQIRAGGKWHHLGNYGTEHEAHAAYLSAKAELHIEARAL